MAATPQLKIYNPQGEYVAACKYFEDAAILVGGYGEGASIRLGHGRVIWREGSEEFSASDSADGAREVMLARIGGQ